MINTNNYMRAYYIIVADELLLENNLSNFNLILKKTIYNNFEKYIY